MTEDQFQLSASGVAELDRYAQQQRRDRFAGAILSAMPAADLAALLNDDPKDQAIKCRLVFELADSMIAASSAGKGGGE